MYIQEKSFIFDLCKWTHPLTLKIKELESNTHTFSAGNFQSEIIDQVLSNDNNIQGCHEDFKFPGKYINLSFV